MGNRMPAMPGIHLSGAEVATTRCEFFTVEHVAQELSAGGQVEAVLVPLQAAAASVHSSSDRAEQRRGVK